MHKEATVKTKRMSADLFQPMLLQGDMRKCAQMKDSTCTVCRCLGVLFLEITPERSTVKGEKMNRTAKNRKKRKRN